MWLFTLYRYKFRPDVFKFYKTFHFSLQPQILPWTIDLVQQNRKQIQIYVIKDAISIVLHFRGLIMNTVPTVKEIRLTPSFIETHTLQFVNSFWILRNVSNAFECFDNDLRKGIVDKSFRIPTVLHYFRVYTLLN